MLIKVKATEDFLLQNIGNICLLCGLLFFLYYIYYKTSTAQEEALVSSWDF